MPQARQQTTETQPTDRVVHSLDNRAQLQFDWVKPSIQTDEPSPSQHDEMEPERWDGLS